MHKLQLEPFDREWSDVVAAYRVVTERDKVRQNSWDDYGLGPDYYFMTGAHVDIQHGRQLQTVWHSLYVRLRPDVVAQIQPRMSEGWIGGVCPADWGDRGIQLIANDRLHIASVHVCRLLTCPADLAIFHRLATIADVPHPVTDESGV